MSKATFVLVVHDHQPVGNFGFVFEEAYEKAYMPFLRVMADHPLIPFGLHVTGSLWEWIDGFRPEFWDVAQSMAARGQLEIIGGGLYEPILPVLPERDQLGQLRMMSDRIADRFGVVPRGAWVAERVWEPEMPKALATAGFRYTFLDDTHFHAAGFKPAELNGYFITGHAEHVLNIFPISQRLRYAVPFKPPEEAVAEICAATSPGHHPIISLADDGEKFGLWPGTYGTCYEEGWLNRFFDLLEAHSDEVEVLSPGAVVDRYPSLGKAYLPSASYFEMTEWALPADASRVLTDIRYRLQESGELDEILPFLKGGHWRNFLAKYPEAARMYHRMLLVSNQVAGLGDADPLKPSAQRALYRAQCNCAYWHGIFGGLYLPHLRGAVWEHLLRAEGATCKPSFPPPRSSVQPSFPPPRSAVQPSFPPPRSAVQPSFPPPRSAVQPSFPPPRSAVQPSFPPPRSSVQPSFPPPRSAGGIKGGHSSPIPLDIDGDGKVEYRLLGSGIALTVRSEDGSVDDLELTDPPLNLLDTVSRRREAYHDLIRTTDDREMLADGEDSKGSIHSELRVKESNLEDLLIYDPYPRRGGIEHLLPRAADLESFERGETRMQSRLIYPPQIDEDGLIFHMKAKDGLAFAKRITVSSNDRSLRFNYKIDSAPQSSRMRRFGVEWCFNMRAGRSDDSLIEVDGVTLDDPYLDSRGTVDGVERVRLTCGWLGLAVNIQLEPAGFFWRAPLQTVSSSEGGVERVLQATMMLFGWEVKAGGEYGIVISI